MVCPLPLPQAPRAISGHSDMCAASRTGAPWAQNTWACPNRQLCDIEQLIPLSSPSVSPETRTPDTRLPSAGKGGRPGSEGLPSHLCSSGSVAAQSMREENGPVCRKRGDGAQLCKPGRENAPQPGVWCRICLSS